MVLRRRPSAQIARLRSSAVRVDGQEFPRWPDL